jgi:hypothetical protein
VSFVSFARDPHIFSVVIVMGLLDSANNVRLRMVFLLPTEMVKNFLYIIKSNGLLAVKLMVVS